MHVGCQAPMLLMLSCSVSYCDTGTDSLLCELMFFDKSWILVSVSLWYPPPPLYKLRPCGAGGKSIPVFFMECAGVLPAGSGLPAHRPCSLTAKFGP